ncbi:MAG: alpha/beta hydrolase [Cyanobacteria bacterium P01_A01_bin.83]
MKSHYKLGWKTRLLNILLNSSKPLEQMNLDELKTTSQQAISPFIQSIFNGRQISVKEIVQQNISGRKVDIPIRLYYPNKQKYSSLILFFHGGGWVYGNFDTHDRLCRRVARDTGAIVLAVDYRLAPFYKYPTALEDCYDALLWAMDNIASSNDLEKVIVMGDSAGGNLAAAVSLMARDLGHQFISQQVLLYPVVSGKLDLASTEKNADAPVLTTSRMQYFVDCYACNQDDVLQSYFSPLLAEDLSNLPPALIITCEYDPLHDQAVRYAERLKESATEVKLIDYSQTIHGFMSFVPFCPEALPAFTEVAKFISR